MTCWTDWIRHIGPKGPPRADTLVPRERVSTSWVPSGKISIGILPRGLKVDQAKEDNDRLRAALDHLTEFSLRSRERRQGLASKAKNPGDLGKRAFVYRLAEGWIFLTGKKPGRHFDPNRNPFLNFVLAATASHREKADELNFSRALDHALRRLRHKNLVSSLARRGPVWTPDALAASD